MQELIQKLQDNHGLTPEQSHGVLDTIKDFVKEKFPMMAGAVDNLLGSNTAATATTTTTVTATTTTEAPKESGSFLDKISDFIPGDVGQKIEDFAKNATTKAEDAFEGLKDKFTK